ncbi:MAG: T9SS type A sorting domain-containing protein, partial [Bacteroidia bacterium]
DSTLSNPVIKQFGTPQTDMIRKLEIDANNTLYAVGYSYGNYSSPNADTSFRTGDVIIQKLDTALNLLDAVQFGTPEEDRGYSSLRDTLIWIGGITEGSMTAASAGSFDAYALVLGTTILAPVSATIITGVSDLENRTSVFPNPAAEQIQISNLPAGNYSYVIFDARGQVVKSGTLLSTNSVIEVGQLAPGLYMLSVSNGIQSQSVHRWIKQ